MSSSSKSKPLSYSEAVRAFSDADVQQDLNDACGKLAHAMSAMMGKFDSIAKQMHTIDLLRLTAPIKPRWEAMRKDLAELLWQFRTNAGVISGRLKLFCTAVLPMAARNLEGRSGRLQFHNESLQVLQSYMTISSEHAACTRSLVERTMRLSALFNGFTTEFSKLVSRHALSGQKEMCDLSHRILELENHVQQLLVSIGELSSPDVAHLVFASSRMVSSAGRTGGRSKLSRKQVVLDGDLHNIGRVYDQLERKRNEVAHAQYNAEMRQSRTDPLAGAHTMLATFLLEELLTSESGLSLFLSIWSRLRTDCSDIFHWIKNPHGQTNTPLVISSYLENGCTLYATLATALDVYAAGVDPSLGYSDRRESR
ncbi:hypothetical protein B0H34DRAFT_722612 [Crassisporium funariophilum]|nr:hypothetical protein B0H34DRAFT_722612 [Crassisporium funariophilum]